MNKKSFNSPRIFENIYTPIVRRIIFFKPVSLRLGTFLEGLVVSSDILINTTVHKSDKI